MGQNFSNMGRAYKQPDETPKTLEAITFDPHHGFDYQRKERGTLPSKFQHPMFSLKLHP
jgi:hypothetical protein